MELNVWVDFGVHSAKTPPLGRMQYFICDKCYSLRRDDVEPTTQHSFHSSRWQVVRQLVVNARASTTRWMNHVAHVCAALLEQLSEIGDKKRACCILLRCMLGTASLRCEPDDAGRQSKVVFRPEQRLSLVLGLQRDSTCKLAEREVSVRKDSKHMQIRTIIAQLTSDLLCKSVVWSKIYDVKRS